MKLQEKSFFVCPKHTLLLTQFRSTEVSSEEKYKYLLTAVSLLNISSKLSMTHSYVSIILSGLSFCVPITPYLEKRQSFS